LVIVTQDRRFCVARTANERPDPDALAGVSLERAAEPAAHEEASAAAELLRVAPVASSGRLPGDSVPFDATLGIGEALRDVPSHALPSATVLSMRFLERVVVSTYDEQLEG
jgi:hypothetical protein